MMSEFNCINEAALKASEREQLRLRPWKGFAFQCLMNVLQVGMKGKEHVSPLTKPFKKQSQLTLR